MSSKADFFQKQNQIIRDTWGKDVDVIFYEGGHEKNELVGDILKLRCGDGLESTFEKTYYAIQYIQNNIPYDFIFRTNTSTYINTALLQKFCDEQNSNTDVLWVSELYSLSEGVAPYPLCIYGRGNGLLFSKQLVHIFLKEAINFLFMDVVDDMYIGNVLNSFWIKGGANYLDHIKSLPHAWYKCVPGEFDCGHKLSNFGKVGDAKYYKDFVTIQVKRYRERELEEQHYYELHEIMKSCPPVSTYYIYKYAENPSVFIGSAIGYMDYDKWLKTDKNWLFEYEISHKANDDEEHYKHYNKQKYKSDLKLKDKRIQAYKKF